MRKFEFISITGVVFLIVMRLMTISPGCDNSHDVFYHITMADLGPSFYMADKLPSLTLSCWVDHFSDKELTFHLLLSGIRKFIAFCGMPTGAPFHVEFLFFAVLLVGSFILSARYFKINKIYLYVIAMVSISPFFITRIVVLRPHLLGISILLISTVLFDMTKSWKKIWIPLLLGFTMAWSYSNPHFILLTAGAFGLSKFSKKQWKLALGIPAVTILGILLGFIIHPQFPNTFINWKIQCIDVVLASLSSTSPVKIGGELSPGNISFFLHNIVLLLLQVINAALFILYIRKINHIRSAGGIFTSETIEDKGTLDNNKNITGQKDVVSSDLKFNRRLAAMYCISLITFLGSAASVRALEYATPLTLLTTGMLIYEYNINIFRFTEKVKKITFISALISVILIMIYGGVDYSRRAGRTGYHPYTPFAAWLNKSGIKPGEVIGNINWSDFPFLFYAAPNYRYLAGVDPMFAYFKYPEKIKNIELFRTGKKLLSPEELFNATGSKYIFVSLYNAKLAEDMFKNGFVAIYQGNDGNLFDLQRSLINRQKLLTSPPRADKNRRKIYQ
jgi:hypothetical protein